MIPNKIILHHSLTKDSKTDSWGTIRDYHVGMLGYRDIGYHFGIELVGSYYETLMGRSPLEDGAHTIGQNNSGIGICFVGNFDVDEVPPGQWQAGIRLVRWLMTTYHIKAADIYGHRDFASYKSCPGAKFDIDLFRLNMLTWDDSR